MPLWINFIFFSASVLIEDGITEMLTPPTMDFDSDLPAEIILSPGAGEIQLKCSAYGNPKPQIYWYHDGELPASGDSNLTIKALPENQGRFQCYANNSEGSVYGINYNIIKKLQYPARLVSTDVPIHNNKPKMEERRYSAGDTLTLSCDVPPSRTVDWETAIPTNHPPSPLVFIDGLEAALYYRSLQRKQILDWDAGRLVKWDNNILVTLAEARDQKVYACKGIRRGNVRVFALYMLNLTNSESVSPVIDKKPTLLPGYYSDKIITIRRGDRLQLDCVFSGFPTPGVYWKKNAEALKTLDNRTTESGRRFVVQEVQITDSGEYTCTGRNRVGSTPHSITVVVQSAPSKQESHLFPNQTAHIGANVSFFCKSSAIPQPEVTWFFNGLKISEPVAKWTFWEGDTELRLRNFQISERGTLVCKVENKLGSFKHSAYLTVEARSPVLDFNTQATKKKYTEKPTHLGAPPSGESKSYTLWLVSGLGLFAVALVSGILVYIFRRRMHQVLRLWTRANDEKNGRTADSAVTREHWRKPKLFRVMSEPSGRSVHHT